jgi:hypothetical protein
LGRYYIPPKAHTEKRRSASKLETPADWILQQNRNLSYSETETEPQPLSADDEPEQVLREIAQILGKWAKDSRTLLHLDPALPVAVRGFHPVHRIASSGELLVEMVAHFVQTKKLPEDMGGLSYRAGVTMIANIDGQIRYLIRKPFHELRQAGLQQWVAAFDAQNGNGWNTSALEKNRITAAFSARAMDRMRWR